MISVKYSSTRRILLWVMQSASISIFSLKLYTELQQRILLGNDGWICSKNGSINCLTQSRLMCETVVVWCRGYDATVVNNLYEPKCLHTKAHDNLKGMCWLNTCKRSLNQNTDLYIRLIPRGINICIRRTLEYNISVVCFPRQF